LPSACGSKKEESTEDDKNNNNPVDKAIKLNATVRRVEELWRKTKKMQNDNGKKQVSPIRPPRPLLEPRRKAEESYKSTKVNDKY